MKRLTLGAALIALSASAHAIDGEILITQAKALAGGVTPGDTPGFPVTISKSGSYKLSGNLTLPDTSTTAIEITEDNVTLDLGGFAIEGPVNCITQAGQMTCLPNSGSSSGVVSKGNLTTVKNGSISGMAGVGLDLSAREGSFVDNVRTSNNRSWGIKIYGGVIRNSIAWKNKNGISATRSVVANNSASFNGNMGILTAEATQVIGNVISNNGVGLSTDAGYSNNALTENGIQFLGNGFNFGGNICGQTLCP